MEEFWILILVLFFATNSLDKAESVQLEEKPLKIIDEIFGEGWWDNDKAKEWDKLTLEQIGPDSTDQNPPLTESDHSDNAKNDEEISTDENIAEDERRRKIVDKFQRKAELTRAGVKNSYKHEIDETVAKELGLNFRTIYSWKSELGQTTPQHKHSHSEQKKLMKHYYEIKDQTPKIRDGDIAKMLKIGRDALYRWKRQFKRHHFHPNSVNGYSVEENVSQINVQKIGNSNLGSN
uniref:Transposase n=1 Tax=Globodera rostochiensis TaxID=31243 RepID=A0A914HS83_GLORO